jgi:hypothetical protein
MQVLQDAEAALTRSEARQRAQLEEVEAALEKEKQVRALLRACMSHTAASGRLLFVSFFLNVRWDELVLVVLVLVVLGMGMRVLNAPAPVGAQASHKQRLKDLAERRGMEELKLSKVLESARALKQLRASLHGVILLCCWPCKACSKGKMSFDAGKKVDVVVGDETGEANGSAAAAGAGDVRQGIEAAAGDALAEQLDEAHGGEVTDHEVFRRVAPL